MRNRLSRKEFLKLMDELWQSGPKVKYQNPDAWVSHL